MPIPNFDRALLIDLPMPIRSARLVIREPRPGDGAAMHEGKTESWESLWRWLPWASERGTLADDELYTRQSHIEFLQRTKLVMYVFEASSGRFVGCSGLHDINWREGLMEIGYWIRDSASGQGYATEVTRALVRYCFEALHAHKVSISHHEGNIASQRVIKKSGFVLEGIERRCQRVPSEDRLLDSHFYSLFDAEGVKNDVVQWGELDNGLA